MYWNRASHFVQLATRFANKVAERMQRRFTFPTPRATIPIRLQVRVTSTEYVPSRIEFTKENNKRGFAVNARVHNALVVSCRAVARGFLNELFVAPVVFY